jgi:phosphoglycerate dehydrogenase-like enzyme
MTAARRLLLSRAAASRWGAGFADLGAQISVLEDVAGDESQTVDAVFISRDITGLSTKTTLQPLLLDCYRVLRRSPELRWVHTHSAGADRPIYAELQQRGVTVTTSSGANAEVVAQTALAGLLALSRRFPELMAAQQARRWTPLIAGTPPRDLAGQRVTLIGWGPIAQRLQPLLSLLGLHVVVVRRDDRPAGPGIPTLPHTRLAELLPATDWLLLACPLTAQTRGLIGRTALNLLPRGAHLINVARGEVVVEPDVVEALQSGQLGGAFLDVFAVEPLPAASPLWQLPNVIVTPHSAGHADGNPARTAAIFTDNLRRWLRDEPLAHIAT